MWVELGGEVLKLASKAGVRSRLVCCEEYSSRKVSCVWGKASTLVGKDLGSLREGYSRS